jgi:arabinogalactan oligomer/maltooligosaccharide transport system permease protein
VVQAVFRIIRRASAGLGPHTASYLMLVVFALFSLYPITLIITIALRPSDELLSTSLALIPKGAMLDNFRILLTQTPFLRWVGNSTVIALAVTPTGAALASTCGYALSRFCFLGRTGVPCFFWSRFAHDS